MKGVLPFFEKFLIAAASVLTEGSYIVGEMTPLKGYPQKTPMDYGNRPLNP